jgi:hypothetical protein
VHRLHTGNRLARQAIQVALQNYRRRGVEGTKPEVMQPTATDHNQIVPLPPLRLLLQLLEPEIPEWLQPEVDHKSSCQQ